MCIRDSNKMISHVKDILIELELPSRILRLCSGDLGFTSSLTYDFELYSVGQKNGLKSVQSQILKVFNLKGYN